MANKSEPRGIRFDLEKVEFIMGREKLQTYQKVVDFLMNKYWWEIRVPVPTAKEVPPMSLKSEFWGGKIELPKTRLRRTVQQYVDLKRECLHEDEWKELLEEIDNADHLTEKQKQLIKIS